MENENDKVEIADEDIQDNDPTEEELGDDTTDWKARFLQERGISKRRATKLAKAKELLKSLQETKPTETKQEVKETKSDLDYGQKAFLKSYGIAGSDELALVREYLATGKSIDEIVENKHFTNDLSDLRETKATKEATPSATKRGAPSGITSVDYWLAKGELPPTDQVQLRRQVLNARIEQERQNSKFSDQPVITH